MSIESSGPTAPVLSEAAAVAKADEIIGALPEAPSDVQVVDAIRRLRAALPGAPDVLAVLARRRSLGLLQERGVRAPAKLLGAVWPDIAAERDGKGASAGPSPPIEPWASSVDGVSLLDEIARTLDRYLVLPVGAATLMAVWIVGTYCFELWDIFPRLGLLSPVKRCGKTTLLGLLGRLVHRPRMASNITPAALFRVIGQEHPTLLIDEADTFLRHNDELKGVLNAGHESKGTVLRCVGDDHEARDFPVYAPVVIAAIGELPGTLADRSIVVRLQRKPQNVEVGKLRTRRLPVELQDLPRKIARWLADSRADLQACDPKVPTGFDDRAADNLYPLLAIAWTAGGNWPARVERAALAVRQDEADESEARTQLLADIRSVFAERAMDRLATSDLLASLCGLEERPWPEFNRGKEMSPSQLARLLRPFKIRPGTIRMEYGQTVKGYYRDQFEDAFGRYLSATGAVTASQGVGLADWPPKSATSGPARPLGASLSLDHPFGGSEPLCRSDGFATPLPVSDYEREERRAIQEADEA